MKYKSKKYGLFTGTKKSVSTIEVPVKRGSTVHHRRTSGLLTSVHVPLSQIRHNYA